ncbi:MAG TPA: ABC transporter permease [Aestuariivirga sp.]|nr:ABC transporter permease [Hyphomicrobiales bacterium]MBP9173626.1 ABC transporter permease [Hyphomicrobiales bacterium]MCC7480846.1 ABC transporter permease [Hyphomicrobiales bacterium]HQY73026.1 ABC transporter permease [Aestuariivirga sp.]
MELYVEILASTIRYTVPLILACIAGLWSERSGIVDIGLEGKMLIAAFVAASGAAVYGSAWIGLGLAILTSVGFALIHGYAAINQRGNQVVSGVAINMLAAGLAVVLGNEWFREGGRTPALPPEGRFLPLEIPGISALADVPGLGAVVKIFFSHSILTYVAFILVPVTAWALSRTRFGLRLRAVGENPHAVDTAGISVARLRYMAVIIAGVLCGIAGTFISISLSSSFVRDITAGTGFMALAALIFANWRAWPALGACLLFGFLQASGTFLQGKHLLGVEIPVQFINMLPYLMTVVLLAGFIGKSIPPRASGLPYIKDR